MGEAMVRLITFGQEILFAFSKSVWAYNTLTLIREEILLWWNGRRVLPLRLLQSIPNLCRYSLIHLMIGDHIIITNYQSYIILPSFDLDYEYFSSARMGLGLPAKGDMDTRATAAVEIIDQSLFFS